MAARRATASAVVVLLGIVAGSLAATRPAATASSDTDSLDQIGSTARLDAAATRGSSVRPPVSLTLAFTGDMLVHSPLWAQAQRNAAAIGRPGYNFRPMLAGLRPVLDRADLAICHLETPIAPAGEPLSTFPLYGVPPEVVEAVAAAGHHRCSTASNHTFDRGTTGIDRTVDILEFWGVGQSGMARTPAEIEPRIFGVGGVTVSHLSYTYGYNGLRPPAGEEWRSAIIDPERVVADARRARALGAQLVVVSLHWGDEGSHRVSATQRTQAEAITASGAVDLIVGHHAHVLQPIEYVNGVPVIFGLGNILSNLPVSDQWPAASQDGAIAVVEVSVSERGEVHLAPPVVHPTWVDKQRGWTVRLVLDHLADPWLDPDLRRQLEASLARTARVLGWWLAST